jgi:hypothetical protein
MKLDLVITSSGRPDLLEITLSGLTKKLLPSVFFDSVYVNIDPVPPTTLKENKQCAIIVNSYFPKANIMFAKKPSFGLAIKNLWSSVSSNSNNSKYFLHFEDDWESIRGVNLRVVSRVLKGFGNTKQLVLRQEVRSIKRSFFRYQQKRRKIRGSYINIPVFSTSPSFIDKEFASNIAELLNPDLHPEKQMNDMTNPKLSKFLENYKCRKYIWLNRKPVIEDLGIEWYREKGFDRVYLNGIPTYIDNREFLK